MCSILLLSLVARYLETIDVCIKRMFVVMSVVVTVWGSVGMFAVYQPLLKYVVCLCNGCDGCCVLCLYCDAWNCRFRHADVVCLCLVCILWKFSMLHPA